MMDALTAPPMQLLTATQVLDICYTAQKGKPWSPARTGGVDGNCWADFSVAVSNIAIGAVVHAPALQGQTQHFKCMAALTDGTRLFEHISAA